MAEQSQSQAEIEIAVTAKMEQLQITLAKAEAAQKVAASKMEVIEAKKAQAAEKVAQQIAVIEQKKAAQIEVLQAKQAQRDADTAAKSAAVAERQAQKMVEIEQKKAATIEALRIKDEQRQKMMMQRMAEQQKKQAQRQLEAEKSQAGGGAFNPLAGIGGIARGVGVLAISNMLLESTQAGVQSFVSGGSGKEVAANFVKGFYDNLKAIPVVGQVSQLVETLLYGFEKAAEEKAAAAAERLQQRLDKELAFLQTQDQSIKTMQQQTEEMRFRASISGLSPEQQRSAELDRQVDALNKQEEASKAQIKQLEAVKTLNNYEFQARDRAIKVEERKLQAIKDQRDAVRDIIRQEDERTANASMHARYQKEQAAIEKKRQEDAVKSMEEIERLRKMNERDVRSAAAMREQTIQKQLEALQAISPVDRQAQMMASAQQSAASMMGSASTALGEFRFAARGVGELALAEAKKQTEKQMKIEQLQADIKRLHEETNRKLDAMKGVA